MIADWYFKPRAAVQRDAEDAVGHSSQQVVQPPAQPSVPMLPVIAAAPSAAVADDDVTVTAGHSLQSAEVAASGSTSCQVPHNDNDQMSGDDTILVDPSLQQ